MTSTGSNHFEENIFRGPCAVATWNFGRIAVDAAKRGLASGRSALASIETGVNAVELDTKDQYIVGYGGLPNADGVMELDAAIMDHRKRYGAVMAIRTCKTPISVAKTIMKKSIHNVMVSSGADKFAREHGFEEENILLESSREEWLQWKLEKNDAKKSNTDSTEAKTTNDNNSTTPSSATIAASENKIETPKSDSHHDTVGMICLDSRGRLCAGTSTSGWKFKHPGRVGDAPIIGCGLYCDEDAAAVATGDGEEIMRNCLSFLIVELIKAGQHPRQACVTAIERMVKLKANDKSYAHTIKSRDNSNRSGSFSSNDDNEDDEIAPLLRECDLTNESDSVNPPSNDKEVENTLSNGRVAHMGHTIAAQHLFDEPLTVAVIAMDKFGNIGSASTLDSNNMTHLGEPYFPCAAWRSKSTSTSTSANESEDDLIGDVHMMRSSYSGDEY